MKILKNDENRKNTVAKYKNMVVDYAHVMPPICAKVSRRMACHI